MKGNTLVLAVSSATFFSTFHAMIFYISCTAVYGFHIIFIPTGQCSMPAGLLFLMDCSLSIAPILDDAKEFAAALMSG